MNKKLRYAPLLLLAPLLMGNSPAPYPTFGKYKDVSVSVVSKTTNGTEAYGYTYRYVIEVTNTGTDYVTSDGGLSAKTNIYLNRDIVPNVEALMNSSIFEREAVGPGQTRRFTVVSTTNYSEDDFNEAACTGFTTVDLNVTYENAKIVKNDARSYNLTIGKISNKSDYYYYAAVDVVYQGENRSFIINGDKTNKVVTSVDLDLEQLEIKNIKFYRSSYNTYHPKFSPLDLVIFGIPALFILVIAASIVIPIVIVTRRRKRVK